MRCAFVLLAQLVCVGQSLDSWNDTGPKRAIVAFVERIKAPGPHYVDPRDRIATFDNDGTLWAEEPVVEGLFVSAKLKTYVLNHPEIHDVEPYKSLVDHEREYFAKLGEEGAIKAILGVLQTVYANESRQDILKESRDFYDTAIYPKPRGPIKSIAYQPMLELLTFLRVNGFQTWICSGGTMDFMRSFSEDLYRIPPQQVIGTRFKQDFRELNGRMGIWRRPEIESLNDKSEKPVNIALQIGRRPLFAAGNVRSGGDVAHLTYANGLKLLINHDDADREFAYEEPDHASLDAAKRGNWVVVSMKQDWKTIFPASAKTTTRGQK